ncbi:FAD-dependent urate hydroxylase [Naganishia albida]|nr:FAD-dependent urate hydroxylase [Naganishia albida]
MKLRTAAVGLIACLISGATAKGTSRNHQSQAISPIRSEQGKTIGSARSQSVPSYSLTRPEDDDKCPPCFNCMLPAFNCAQFGECSPSDGQCKCPDGWGGQDCLTPLCGSLAGGADRYPRKEGERCECEPGWSGINCNVCEEDRVCKAFKPRYPSIQEATNSNDEEEDDTSNMVCYKGGLAVQQNYQMCDVTNRKIIDTIPDNKKPQVTFSCTANGPSSNDSSSADWKHPLLSSFAAKSSQNEIALGLKEDMGTCSFQFWVDEIESFYCKLEGCGWEGTNSYESNRTRYECKTIDCACVPGRFLCGENGSVNIDDFLSEEVKGPATFQCNSGKGCSFEEPAMNGLINDIFGDRSITLDCNSGECLHYTQVPGYQRPEPPNNSLWVGLSAGLAATVFLLASLLLWYLGRTKRHPEGFNGVRLPSDEAAKLMTDHVPATLHFENLSYSINNKAILTDITGSVSPGQVMAILGSSGAGKSTFLDILARKDKRGRVTGRLHINGSEIDDDALYRRVIGFVDQEDTLMPTLTVYETVLYSAVLRLPREMSLEAKKFRTLETMNELGILGIKDSRIGESGKRSISGGEKRRVSIACELVTSPSILFLDEPTSGLDSYNAYNVVESLVTLARDYNRTVVFTIHQPQSNIVSMFDRLLLLAKGRMVYSGDFKQCAEHFSSLGYPCPPGYNIADYLIDVTTKASGDHRGDKKGRVNEDSSEAAVADVDSAGAEIEAAEEYDERQSTLQRYKAKFQSLVRPQSRTSIVIVPPVPEKLEELVSGFRDSDQAKITEAEIHRIHNGEGLHGSREITTDATRLGGYKKASWWTQFKLLSGRAFKNLYRNPLLMAAHYVMAIVVAFVCGFFFYKVTNDIPGFQNRLGLFLFILSLFGFSTLTSLGVFANERMLFMRERANGYYSPITYFASKVLFDILPLRVIPPFILGSIVYGLAGLNPSVASFWKFILTLVLFNLAASSIVLFLSVAIADTGVANLLGSMVMLYNLLFAGLLMNYDRVPHGLKWMQTTSFFHAGYEALLVNELRYLQLIEHKFGLDIQVPSATILSSFGFHAQAFWWPDISLLCIVFGVFIIASFLALQLFVKERR